MRPPIMGRRSWQFSIASLLLATMAVGVLITFGRLAWDASAAIGWNDLNLLLWLGGLLGLAALIGWIFKEWGT